MIAPKVQRCEDCGKEQELAQNEKLFYLRLKMEDRAPKLFEDGAIRAYCPDCKAKHNYIVAEHVKGVSSILLLD